MTAGNDAAVTNQDVIITRVFDAPRDQSFDSLAEYLTTL